MAKELKVGSKVTYNYGGKVAEGEIYGVKKAQDVNDNDVILAYLVDTGRDNPDMVVNEIVTPKVKDKNIVLRQPELVEVKPEDIVPKK